MCNIYPSHESTEFHVLHIIRIEFTNGFKEVGFENLCIEYKAICSTEERVEAIPDVVLCGVSLLGVVHYQGQVIVQPKQVRYYA